MQRRVTPDRFLSDAELAAFMDAVRTRRHKNQPRDHALFALLVNTGMRPSEARALRRRDVRLDTFTIQPSPASAMAGTTPWARSTGAWTLTSNIRRRRFRVSSPSGP